ncbi:hypothetical protein GLOTRDRAFT_128800 [Gloeophyllum trabeum ATCC 11539]|uniref:Uncharacterized protein n=1 Tax=Gloeophyllum trabeum (strain ATCC 11539 / FP-39264 / Madison 617) TaxID=670483 RepID=S7RRJ3_GLOTA|nr:uncharacterized protein GLOTRDRAFT_128800 [Gloeophyllum trabeum ATCC 11539]EPQ55574.1 hypothetical protein GLOTRDRAFT_128800 [Gloeophyllum trabeum ATCC 11539]
MPDNVVPFEKSPAVLRARRDIEHQIKSGSDFWGGLRLKTQLNTLVSVARLPAELLALIFRAYIDLYVQKTTYLYDLHYRRGRPKSAKCYQWFGITHVCRDWREVALGTPWLWVDITITRIECVQQMLARSKNAPLTVHGHIDRSRVEVLKLIWREDLHRIRDLDVALSDEILEELPIGDSRNTPIFRSLRLSTGKPQLWDVNDDALSSPFISSLASASLEEVNLLGFSLQSFQVLVPVSTLITLRWCTVERPVEVRAVLALLRNMPLLRTLKLRGLTAASRRDITSGPVDLPQLQCLHIWSAVTPCAELLAHLSLPVGLTMHLVIERFDGLHMWEYSRIMEPVLVAIHNITSSDPLRTISVTKSEIPPLGSPLSGYGYAFDLKAWTTVVAPESHIPSADPRIRLTLQNERYPQRELVKAIVPALPLDEVNYLRVEEGLGYFQAWKETFRQLRNIKTLHVYEVAAESLPDSLCFNDSFANKQAIRDSHTGVADNSGSGDAEPGGQLFPCLEYLRLERVMFFDDFKAPTHQDFMQKLFIALKSRSAMFLHLDVCGGINFTGREADLLKTVVHELTWDEVVEIEQPDSETTASDGEEYEEENDKSSFHRDSQTDDVHHANPDDMPFRVY